MIKEIQFPADPENYVWILQPRFASVYLIARAIQHYGGHERMEIVCPTFRRKADLLTRRVKYLNVCEIASSLGIDTLKFVALENVLGANTPRFFEGAVDNTLILQKYMDIIKVFDPSAGTVVGEDGFITSLIAMKNLTLMRVANLVDDNLNPNTTTPHKTLAMWNGVPTSTGRESHFLNVLDDDTKWKQIWSDRPPFWSPLLKYSLDEMLQEAKKFGVIDHIQLVNNCEGGDQRTIRCGQCHTCIARRHAFIQAGIEDKAQYEFS